MSLTVRPWGTFETLHARDNYLIKRIVVHSKHRLSLQSHECRAEHWVVVKGHGTIILGEDEIVCGPNTQVFIPKKTTHRIINSSDNELVFVEVQVGNFLSEDDIVRYEDDYARM